jgi:multidrug efflux pump subunit AcrA (membrane-fusion protein)
MDDASPRFRQDLESSNTETDGVACVDVTDPKTGTNFRFYDFEYQLAQQLNGQPFGDVISWASAAFGVDLTVEGIKEFAGRLSELGFLEAGSELDDAEAEWVAAEGAKTAQFVPDPGMLDSPSEHTPVAPMLPTLEADAAATEAPEPKPAEAPTAPMKLFDIPMPAAAPAAPPAPARASAPTNDVPNPQPSIKSAFAPSTAKPSASWAMDLDDNLKPAGEKTAPAPDAPAARDAAADTMTPPPLPRLPDTAATPPPLAKPAPVGAPERRQPPAPDAVQMAAFTPDAAAAEKAPEKKGNAKMIVIILLLLAAAAIGIGIFMRERARLPQAVSVRVLSPKPAAVYRWFSGSGTVTDHEARTLAFESPGTLAELLPPGTAFVAGDILGRLRGAQPVEALLGRQRARLAFYQQMRDSMRAANNQPELRQAEIKLADKQRLVDETIGSLAKLVVRASEPGEVVETFAKVGMPVRANAPMLRVKGRVLHGEFVLDGTGDMVTIASQLRFCRVEVIGLGPHASNAESPSKAGTAADVGSPDAQATPRFIDCTNVAVLATGARKLRVTLPDNLGLVPGQPLRLARERFDAVFPIPAGAVGGSEGHRTIWIARPAGTAELRDVVVADGEPAAEASRIDLREDVLVTDGMHVGDEVIVDAPATLMPGASIAVER